MAAGGSEAGGDRRARVEGREGGMARGLPQAQRARTAAQHGAGQEVGRLRVFNKVLKLK